jgi:hypothetical protein
VGSSTVVEHIAVLTSYSQPLPLSGEQRFSLVKHHVLIRLSDFVNWKRESVKFLRAKKFRLEYWIVAHVAGSASFLRSVSKMPLLSQFQVRSMLWRVMPSVFYLQFECF